MTRESNAGHRAWLSREAPPVLQWLSAVGRLGERRCGAIVQFTFCGEALPIPPHLPLKTTVTDVAVDTSMFSTSRIVRWFNREYGPEIDNR